MEITTIDTEKKLQLNAEIFQYEYNEGLVFQAVQMFLNNARSGNSAQKTRSEVRGGGRKPWAQKGTGRARAGSIRSPLWRGGGVTFAAKKRDYSQKMNKKMYKRAMRSIISQLLRNEDMLIVSQFDSETPKTKSFLVKMEELGLKNALIVKDEITENDYLASRNLIDFDVCDATCVDPYNLIRFEKILITESALKLVEEQLQ
ncbi:MAG: 50S ribosomal protein L4 [Legionellaceae bacterium]|nr:50S ribosomal protein L4 [Legionellaceae bacterium]